METIISNKSVEELPLKEELRQLKNNQERILGALESYKIIQPPEYFTVSEFMEKAMMGRWKFNQLRSNNTIKVIQRGKKLFVPATEVRRYFEGEME
ncbi:hypothetical protein [Reichenbachiella sp. MALMAid0571]|uniref:hypothetical protein n=1 Tax=Reichenbachiella sp. MALMAid0571 TaxID=3143939 RepID=UPI0032E0571D